MRETKNPRDCGGQGERGLALVKQQLALAGGHRTIVLRDSGLSSLGEAIVTVMKILKLLLKLAILAAIGAALTGVVLMAKR